MCGIFSLIHSPEQTKNDYIDECKKSYNLLRRRGPDRGTFEYDNVNYVYGFQRLSINDLSSNGDQPMKTEKSVLMCNGEIFNHLSLISKYDLVCKSQSDCEVLLHLYDKGLFSPELFREINGDFAMFIDDTLNNKVILARDRIGVRPLFYGFTKNNNHLVVSSEIKCMPMCHIINHVPPGTYLVYDKQTQTFLEHRYYDVLKTITFTKPLYCLKYLLINATKIRLNADRPIGCLLSGGLDSSIITYILCHLLGPENVRTYSIGIEGSADLKYAKKVASFLGTNHTEVKFTPEEGLSAIPEVIYNLESYDITTVRASVGMYLLGKYISKNTTDKVIFSGEGSDELLCGYLYFHYAPTGTDAHDESLRLISDLYKYDALRADRCISSHGLELRVPFLDKDVINFCTSIHGHLKQPTDGMEKKLLREQFVGNLPDDVLWRRKDGFSDGVSSNTKNWYEYITEFVEKEVNVENLTISKEAYYYKSIYDKLFPNYPKPIDYYWMPKWIKTVNQFNPAGRALSVFKN